MFYYKKLHYVNKKIVIVLIINSIHRKQSIHSYLFSDRNKPLIILQTVNL